MSNSTDFSAVRAGLGASKRMDSNAKYVYAKFYGPLEYSDGLGGAAAVTDAAINTLRAANGETFQVRLEQAFAGSAPQVSVGALGAALTLDAADNDGIGIDLGYGAAGAEVANTRGAYIVGTEAEGFFVRAKLNIADVSDADQIAVGFVKGGFPADGLLDTLTDYAVLNVDNGDIKVETRLNSGTASVTDTTQDVADAGTVTLEVRVTAGGVAHFFVDGAAPTVTQTGFEFDDDTVNAVLLILADAAGDPGVQLIEWESGPLSARGLRSIDDLAEKAQSVL